ncbi:MAG TPA: 50S ribosomal protein L29 [Thermoplasmatales archaeon]|nr:MAG: 50S ribosomal protein L29 [Thermoplasmata archaeon]RLF32192.1 MAG: 50S ribosomal protein L29 [Thermoplasmata archaeon]HDN50791.1 50S ribosomal protein L29 [Thermoplasmatales archaeon]
MKAKEIRAMSSDERRKKLKELRNELMEEYGRASMGGSPPSPGRIRYLRSTVARLLTVMREEGEL